MDRVFSRTWISPLKKKGYARTASNPSASAHICTHIYIYIICWRSKSSAACHNRQTLKAHLTPAQILPRLSGESFTRAPPFPANRLAAAGALTLYHGVNYFLIVLVLVVRPVLRNLTPTILLMTYVCFCQVLPESGRVVQVSDSCGSAVALHT